MSSSQPAQIDGHSVPIAAFQPRKGLVSPTVIEGREPLRPDEIALGSLTMRTLAWASLSGNCGKVSSPTVTKSEAHFARASLMGVFFSLR